MAATIIGLILLHGGYIALIVGIMQNRSLEAQFWAIVQTGVNNPGNIWIIAGAAAVLLGTIILIVSAVKTAKKNKKPKYY